MRTIVKTLTKAEQLVLELFKELKSKEMYVVINLADNGGVRYIEPILPHWKEITGYNGVNGYKSTCKVPQYDITQVFVFNEKKYCWEQTLQDSKSKLLENMRRTTPTIIKNLVYRGLIKPLPIFSLQIKGNREDPALIAAGYLTFEADYFFVPFELV